MTKNPLDIEQRGAVRWLWLNRPDTRNAFNDELIGEISRAFADVEASAETRVVVMAARGNVFCAGADLNYMRPMAGYSHAETHAEDRERELPRMPKEEPQRRPAQQPVHADCSSSAELRIASTRSARPSTSRLCVAMINVAWRRRHVVCRSSTT